ncbi:MAG: hypothetical protein C0502_05035 [Opitutus sp.]|nr:hypothetical protein [Opitutus sp.]
MSKRRIVKLPAFNGVNAGQRATLTLPVGARKYHSLIVQYKDGTANQATTEAALKTLRVLVNGKSQREILVSQLNAREAYLGRTFQAGTVLMPFSENTARTWQGEELLGWGTFNVSTLTAEIDIDAAAVAPALTAYAEIEDSTEPLGGIVKWRRNSFQTAGAGVLAIRDLPRDPREAYQRFHIFTASATEVQLKADSDVIVETISRDLLAKHYSRRPQKTIMQAGVLTLDLVASTQVTDFLPMLRTDNRLVQDFPLEVTVSGASNFDIITEVFGPAL